MQKIPTLDGWRGIAILMVLVTHFQATFFREYRWGSFGVHGVQVFFVLSGYLITSQLLAEDRINLRTFYIRRVFRILPAALTYLSVLILLTTFTPFKVCGSDIWACIFLFRNYVSETMRNTCTEHFWSLVLEEQFYLFWPALLALAGRWRATIVAALLVAGITIFRLYEWSFYDFDTRFQRTEVHADGILIGCLLALALSRASLRAVATKWGPYAFWPALLLFTLDISRFHHLIPLHESLAIVVMIAATSLCPQLLPSRMLELEHLKTTGVLSYSIYIWQGLFLRPNWGMFWPFLLASSFLLSYVLIELPARQLGRRLAARLTIATETESRALV